MLFDLVPFGIVSMSNVVQTDATDLSSSFQVQFTQSRQEPVSIRSGLINLHG